MAQSHLRLAAAVAIVAGLVALAAGSGPVRIWTTPTTAIESPSVTAEPLATGTQALEEKVQGSPPEWNGLAQRTLAVTLMLLSSAVALLLIWGARHWRLVSRFGRGDNSAHDVGLPLVGESGQSMDLDVDAAFGALSRGDPRNAIVACWVKLEQDAAAVGLSRHEAETPSEYVQRVVAASSIDDSAITELAGLYREARFSRHEFSDDDRARAALALNGVAEALGPERCVPT